MDASILVAGKSSQNYNLVKTAFADEDVNIVRATTMSLALFLAQKNLPFLIVADIDLVDGDAESFLFGLRSDYDLQAIPVVFLSSVPMSLSARSALLEGGASKVLTELKSATELLDEISPLIRTHGSKRVPHPSETTE